MKVTGARPHGLKYSFTFHGPDNARLVGHDNSHTPQATRKGVKRSRATVSDHRHRHPRDKGQSYAYRGAVPLITDFFADVDRYLVHAGIKP